MNPALPASASALSDLRFALLFFTVATAVSFAGIASLLLFAFRSRDRSLLWLGIFAVFYGVRLFLQNGLVHAASGLDVTSFARPILCLTYLVPIPYALFARELLGDGWQRAIAIWLWLEGAFAAIAIPAALYFHQVDRADRANGILIIAGTLLILFHVIFRRTSDSIALTWPPIVFGILVLLNNQGFRPGGHDIEPLGFVVLLAALGFAALRRTIARERKLTEVEQELTTARRIQNAILPECAPQINGLSLATRYQPMTSVAGDFFDFLKTGESGLTILVADVSGHGVPAALIASMLKVGFAAQSQHAHDPARVLSGLNATLRGSLGGQYVTAACAAIDLTSQTVAYAGAGHPPGLLLRKTAGEVLPLAENGLFLGPFPHATYSNMRAPFEPGDKLLLYTDGILEAETKDGREFGEERLTRFFLNAKDLAPRDLVERLFEAISNPAQQDDLTAVLAQFDAVKGDS